MSTLAPMFGVFPALLLGVQFGFGFGFGREVSGTMKQKAPRRSIVRCRRRRRARIAFTRKEMRRMFKPAIHPRIVNVARGIIIVRNQRFVGSEEHVFTRAIRAQQDVQKATIARCDQSQAAL
jgi:hypothetical protein